MKNSIKIISGNDESLRVIADVKNDGLIKQYGLLQQIESVDEKDIAQARNIANNLLKELGKISEENSLTLMGSTDIKAGRLIDIAEEITGMKGRYLIKDCTHNYNSLYTVDLS